MSVTKKSGGSIHRIREFELEKVSLAEEFDILQIVGEGWFGKILLVEHRTTDAEMVLKALPKPYISLRDFYREFHYGLTLGVHKNIVTTFDVAFETAGFYVFTQEYAPLGDLTANVSETGIGELHTKRVAKQIASALDYMHSKEIVHRDVKLDNVLVFRSDFSRVKLCDFGESRKGGTMVLRRNEWLPYSPPEVLSVRTDDTYKTDPSHDVWQFGIVVFVCLTGCLPWQKAAADDPRYMRYIVWHSSALGLRRCPKLFKLVSNRGCKMFKKFLEPRPDRRPKGLGDLQKFLEDRWLAKGAEKDLVAVEPDELCPSMYSFHSSPEEKNILLSTLAEYGIETTVDRVAKKVRIRDWIQSSVIVEDEEENDSGRTTPSSTMSRTPVPGHVSSIRAVEIEQDKSIKTTIKDSANKHFNPRTGLIQQGPSEMGSAAVTDELPVPVPVSVSIITTATINIAPHSSFDNHINNNHNNGTDRNNSIIHQGRTSNNYSIMQQYTNNAQMFESGEKQTLIDARLNIPILSKSSNNINIIHNNNNNNNNYDKPPEKLPRSKSLKLTTEKMSISPTLTTTPLTNNNKKKTSQGLMSAFNSVAMITVPEIKQATTPIVTTTTTKQQQTNNNNNNSNNSRKHSSSSNSNKNNNNNNTISNLNQAKSPILVKRSSIKSSSNSDSLHMNNSSKDPSPFDSDENNDSQRGSTGFVNFVGMKDSPYDRVKTRRNK